MEEDFFEIENNAAIDKVFVLIIYDIVSNKRRVKFAKLLQGYGFRIQKSAFEAVITKRKYNKLIAQIRQYISSEDSVKVYKIIGKGQVTSFGKSMEVESEEIIII